MKLKATLMPSIHCYHGDGEQTKLDSNQIRDPLPPLRGGCLLAIACSSVCKNGRTSQLRPFGIAQRSTLPVEALLTL
jgi:hypothetical protein